MADVFKPSRKGVGVETVVHNVLCGTEPLTPEDTVVALVGVVDADRLADAFNASLKCCIDPLASQKRIEEYFASCARMLYYTADRTFVPETWYDHVDRIVMGIVARQLCALTMYPKGSGEETSVLRARGRHALKLAVCMGKYMTQECTTQDEVICWCFACLDKAGKDWRAVQEVYWRIVMESIYCWSKGGDDENLDTECSECPTEEDHPNMFNPIPSWPSSPTSETFED